MGSQLDSEFFLKKLDELMKRFTRCITYFGGFVDKYMGDGIMPLFGAKQATEQDSERAILAALKMIEQLEVYNKKLQLESKNSNNQIGIRIGINSGLVIVGKVGEERERDFTVTGAAVNLAQRMEANAPTGKILVPVHTKQAVERSFIFEQHGYVQAKGFAIPIESYIVVKHKVERDFRWKLFSQ
jgi:adenylate cyclase